MHLAFSAPSRARVAAVHEAALSALAASGGMFTDLDGHRIEVKTDEP